MVKLLVSTESETSVVCIIGYDLAGNNSEKTCSDSYKLDKQKPVLTVTSEDIEIEQGANTLVSSYFNVSYGISGGTLTCNPENTDSLAIGNHTINCTATSGSGLTQVATTLIIVNPKTLFKIDTSGANAPTLFNNMIPIAYNGTNWIRVEENQVDWYSYNEKGWANAAVLNSGITKNVGDTINVDTDISLMLVWIPRYKYTIFNGNNGIALPQQIDIIFESGINSTGTVICNNDLKNNVTSSEICSDSINSGIKNNISIYTHPAFCFGNRTNGVCNGSELTGIWVGKYENSAPIAESNTIQKVTIKPNVVSWSKATVSTFFNSIQKIKTDYEINADSHMIKNMEWGAVAYLSHSKYGLCNSETCTGINATQSTTNNIYGIYDMNGGRGEYVMGNHGIQFTNGNAGFDFTPSTKYYDSYSTNSESSTHGRGKLGDATKETLVEFGNRYNRYAAWYGGGSDFLSTWSWISRGDRVSGSADNSKMFSFAYESGIAISNGSRSVISEP